jgi:hypothetical protein
VILAALFAGLFAWDRALRASERTARTESVRVGPLIPSSDQARIQERMAALEVESGGRSWRFLPFAGMWRCIDYLNAPADLDALNSLIERLLSSAGIAQAEDSSKFADYGIGSSETIVVTFHGQRVLREQGGQQVFAGDPLLKVEVGRAVPGRDGCYARLAGSGEVWAVDASPLDLLGPARAGGPPMLDPNVVAKSWPGGTSRSVEQVLLERDGELLEFSVRRVEVTPDEAQRGAVPFEWTLARNGALAPCHSILTAYWSSFLLAAPWSSLADPATASQLGFGQPGSAAVTLVPAEGQPLRLELSPPGTDGAAFVLNPNTGCLYVISPDVLSLLAPDLALLDVAATENPWDEFLRARAGR